jgi:hypothetical protein
VRPVFDPQSPMFDFFSGMTAMGFLVATLFFFRFWVKTNDWLFFRFGFSFILFACNQFMLVVSDSPRDDQSTIYLLRLSGYILIVAAILGKTLLGRGASRQK